MKGFIYAKNFRHKNIEYYLTVCLDIKMIIILKPIFILRLHVFHCKKNKLKNICVNKSQV